MTTTSQRHKILSAPGARTLLGSSIFARLPLAMFGIALLVHAQRLTGSFTIAGLVTGAYAIASAVSAPLLGGVIDRAGQTRVLICGASATALLLVANGLLPSDVAPALLIALGGATGITTPPLDACVRTLLPAIAADPRDLPALFALESTVLELTFVAGPPLALGLGAVWTPGAALAVSGLLMLAGTLVFAMQPASRRWRPEPQAPRARGGSLRSPVMRTLIVTMFGLGATFGATEVGVTAAAHALGDTTAAGPLLGVWGLGSFLGGMAATRLGGGGRRRLIQLVAGLALAHGALVFTSRSVIGIALVITVAGATIAPTESIIYALVDSATPAGNRTEAFSWLVTAALCGGSLGASLAGALAQRNGAVAAFALGGVAGGVALLGAVIGSRTLEPRDGASQPELGLRAPLAER
jgi:MFS family permease